MNALHPQEDKLAAFGAGRLDPAEAREIETHIADCPACCETLLNLTDDTFIGLVRRSVQVDFADAPVAVGADTILPDSPDRALELPAALLNHPRYRVLAFLGRGGMGDVYKAEHTLMNRTVAVKVINRKLLGNPQVNERIRREVQTASRLAHRNIVTAYDAEATPDGNMLLVMEHVDGTDLAQVVKERGPLPVAEACDYIVQAAEGLQHAFERGMVHRDIKPQNLMVTKSTVKILDFGLARFASEAAIEASGNLQGETDPDEARVTACGTLIGTPDYLSPEQSRDAHSADIRADIYSLGCTLYFLLAGKPPFPEGSVLEKLTAHRECEAQSLCQLRSDVPVELDRIVSRMMAKDPAARYQTPADVAAALRTFINACPQPRPRRYRRLQAAMAAAAIVLLGVILYVQLGTSMVRFEIDDPSLAVRFAGDKITVDNDGNELRIWYAGPQQFVIEQNGFEVKTDSFTIKRGAKIALRVTIVDGIVTVERSDAKATVTGEPRRVAKAGMTHFPADEISWADNVVSFKIGETNTTKARDPAKVLGKPDSRWPDDQTGETWVALGHGGELIVEFTDNLLIDGKGPDLAVFEVGGQPIDPFDVAISRDGKKWIDVGKIRQGTRAEVSGAFALDIAGLAQPGEAFRFVKLTDVHGELWGTPGADIDAVGAINTLRVPPEAEVAALLADAYFVMNFGSGTLYEKDGKLHVRDLSRHGNDGRVERNDFGFQRTLASPFTRYMPLQFSKGEGITLPRRLLPKSGPFTVAGWFNCPNPNSPPTGKLEFPLYTELLESGGTDLELAADIEGNGNLTIANRYAPQAKTTDSRNKMGFLPGAVTHQKWFFAAWTYDGKETTSSATIKYTVDQVTSQADTLNLREREESGQAVLGRGFEGMIDDVTIFHRALSAEELQKLYCYHLAGKELPAPEKFGEIRRFTAHLKARQAETAARLKLPVITSSARGLRFALVPAGEFEMGTAELALEQIPADDAWFFARFVKSRRQAETPGHRVTISKPFYLGTQEVTVGQFRRFVEQSGYQTEAEREGAGYGWRGGQWVKSPEFNWRNPGFPQTDDHPVCNVSWADAVAFCKWLDQSGTGTHRLPTEAEWEYACRAWTEKNFYSGDEPASLVGFANLADQSLRAVSPNISWAVDWNDGYPFTSPVGTFRPNALELDDMHGNAWEWCQDTYDSSFYRGSPAADPLHTGKGEHVFRGGGFDNWPGFLRSADRYSSHSETLRTEWAGFRVVREIPDVVLKSALATDVDARLRQDFAEANQKEARDILFSCRDATGDGRLFDRICRCLLFVAAGDLAMLRRQAEFTKTDWRDTIVAAEYEAGDRRVRNFSRPFADAEKKPIEP